MVFIFACNPSIHLACPAVNLSGSVRSVSEVVIEFILNLSLKSNTIVSNANLAVVYCGWSKRMDLLYFRLI